MQNLRLKLRKFRDKIEILSNHNPLCRNFAASCRACFLTHNAVDVIPYSTSKVIDRVH